MPAFGPLYTRVANSPVVPGRLPLVVLMTGFTDAGGTVAGLVDFARDELDPHPLVTFSNDSLLDYRARRPVITFDQDHLTEYRPPRLELSLAHDALGQPFLVLSGYEPDFGWDAFVDAVGGFVDDFDIASVTWVHAIPMPVPHTRSLGATVSGTRGDLVEEHSVWRPQTQAPATIGHLLELRMIEAGHPTTGFVLLVPHYLSDTEFPGASALALEKIMAATGLVFDLADLREENETYIQKVEEQISGNEELRQMIHRLEERHDAYMAGELSDVHTDGGIDESSLPSADELAAELERYLASRPTGDDDKSS